MKAHLILLGIISLFLVSCASKEQKISEGALKESLKAPSTYKFISFGLESIETMGDELEGRIALYQTFVDHDKGFVDMNLRFVESAKDDVKESERDRMRYGSSWDTFLETDRKRLASYESELLEAVSKLERDQGILDALIKLQGTEDLTLETGRIYALTYEAQNSFGVPLRGVFRTHFKANGELVGYKSDDDAWVQVGRVFSIPGYYDLIGEQGQ